MEIEQFLSVLTVRGRAKRFLSYPVDNRDPLRPDYRKQFEIQITVEMGWQNCKARVPRELVEFSHFSHFIRYGQIKNHVSSSICN